MKCDCKGVMSFLQKQSLQQVVYCTASEPVRVHVIICVRIYSLCAFPHLC